MQVLPITLSAQPCDSEDRRRALREVGCLDAQLTAAGREPCPAILTDLSRQGCCAVSEADWLRPGRFVAITLASGTQLPCIVRWTRAGTAGLELLRPFAAPCAEWLALNA